MIEYILGLAGGVVIGAFIALAFVTPGHVAICEYEGGTWQGQVCVKGGRVIPVE